MKARTAAAIGLALLACVAAAATGTADARLAGNWRLDAAGSDDFGAQLARFVAASERDWQRRMRARERDLPPPGQDTGIVLDDEAPPEPTDSLRMRLTEALQPPSQLTIALNDGSVDLDSAENGKRRLPLNEKMIRVDASGSAEITARLAGRSLTVDYRYLSRARQTQVYSVGSTADTLQTTVTYSERNGGKLVVKSLYRRSP